MKLTALAAFMAGSAGLLQVGALPIRVLVVTSSTTGVNTNNPAFQHLRFGHAVPPVAWLQDPHAAGPVGGNRAAQHRRPCGGRNRFKNRVKAKTLEITNFFRGALGLPLKEPEVHHHHPHHGKHGKHHGEHHGKDHKGEGEHGEEGPVPTLLPAWTSDSHPYMPNNMAHLPPGMTEYHHFGKANCFGMRLHRALMALGPWEGRALAFVLGCGIGVLLRMFWVFAVVMYRFAKGPRTHQAPVYSPVLFSAEDVLVPPPTYVFEADVKTPIVFEDVKTPIVEDVQTPVVVAEEAKKTNEEESK